MPTGEQPWPGRRTHRPRLRFAQECPFGEAFPHFAPRQPPLVRFFLPDTLLTDSLFA
jgi:hypothetical protein